MLILTEKAGQLCNRLFQYAHLIAFCKRHQIKIVHLAFYDYAQYFNSINDRLFISFPSSSLKLRNGFIRFTLQSAFRFGASFIQHIVPRFMGITKVRFDVESAKTDEILESALGHPLIFINGFYFRDSYNLNKYADAIKNYFMPKEIYTRMAKEINTQLRKNSEMIIGLHIRRGDYKYHENGKYYFEDKVYIRIIQDIITQFPGKGVKVFIASNESLRLENYACVSNYIVWESREPIVDLMALTLCDYLVGPPSTFSMWASFYGNVPLLIIKDPQQKIDLRDAAIVKG